MPNTTNEVVINGEVILSTRGNTVTEDTLVQGKTAQDKTGKQIEGSLDPVSHEELNELKEQVDALDEKAYKISDDEGEIEDGDYIPFNDASDENEPKKKTLFSSIIDKLKDIFVPKSELKSHTFEMGTVIPADSDLDDYKTEGVYFVNDTGTAETIDNIPVASAGKLIVMDRDIGTRIFQIYIASKDNIYIRDMNNESVFSAWKNISRSHTFETGMSIPANSDLNTYVTAGVYKIAPDTTAQTISNLPVADDNIKRGGKLIVNKGISSSETWTLQIYINNLGHIFKRKNDSSTWSNWTQLATIDVSVLWEQNNVIGAKNHFDARTYSPKSDTGLTTTYNENGSVTISAGTTTAEFLYPNNFYFYDLLPNTKYIFSIGTSHASIRLQAYYKATSSDTGWTHLVTTANVSEITIAIPSTFYCAWIRIGIVAGVTLASPITIYPMLRLASIKDGTFEPYTETNQELTDSLQSKQHYLGQPSFARQILANDDLNDYTASGTYQCAHANIATTLSNCPVSTSFKLVVDRAYVRSNSEITQRITCQNLSGSTDWIRTIPYNGASWGEWKHIASYQDVSPATIGDGYAVASVSGSAITATISGFQLRAGVIVTLKCNFDMPQNATLNISSTGAKQIMWWLDNGIRKIDNQNLNGMTITFMYDGSYYRIISVANTPRVFPQSYVANTSGSVVIASGYDQNAFQIKYRLEYNKLLWNYYKNSAWRGDVYIADYDDIVHQTLGTSIPENADLNTYTTKGIYNIYSNAKALTISNRPCDRAGKLVVEAVAGVNYICQIYNTYDNSMQNLDGVYRRTGYDGGTNWTTWVQFAVINTNNRYLYLENTTTTAEDKDTGISIGITDTTTGKRYNRAVIRAFQDHQADPNGLNMVIDSGSSLFLGSGEAGISHYSAVKPIVSEHLYITSDGHIFLQANANTIANRLGFRIDINGNLYPCKADAIVDNQGKIGGEWNKLQEIWTYNLNGQSIENVIVAKTSGITPETLDDIPVNTTGWVTLSASLSPTGTQIGFIYSCYKEGGGNRKAIQLMRVAFDKHSENCWMNGYNGSTWTGWIPLTNQKKTYVGTCDTAGGTKDKVATVDDNFALMKGVRVSIKFTNSNTYSNVTTSPITLNVNGTGAKNIWYWQTHSGAGNTGTNTIPYGYAGRYANYYYDGTYWVWDGMSGESNDDHRKSFYGTCTTAGDQQVKVVTLADTTGWELRAGTLVGVKFSNSNTYSATADNHVQLNVNNTGAKNIYYNLGYPTGTNTIVFGYANRTHYYMYNGTDWVWISAGTEVDTVDPRSLGFGYGTCATAEATTAKVVTLSSYTLRTGGFVAVKFTYAVPANSTMNINSRGAKEIWHRGAKITANKIKAGDLATFVYDGTRYQLVANDRYIT